MCWQREGTGPCRVVAGGWHCCPSTPGQGAAAIPLGEDADLVKFKVPRGRIGQWLHWDPDIGRCLDLETHTREFSALAPKLLATVDLQGDCGD